MDLESERFGQLRCRTFYVIAGEARQSFEESKKLYLLFLLLCSLLACFLGRLLCRFLGCLFRRLFRRLLCCLCCGGLRLFYRCGGRFRFRLRFGRFCGFCSLFGCGLCFCNGFFARSFFGCLRGGGIVHGFCGFRGLCRFARRFAGCRGIRFGGLFRFGVRVRIGIVAFAIGRFGFRGFAAFNNGGVSLF